MRHRDKQQRGPVSAPRAIETGTRGLPLDDPHRDPGDETADVSPVLPVRDPEAADANRALRPALPVSTSAVATQPLVHR
jgi:hypothetical protein